MNQSSSSTRRAVGLARCLGGVAALLLVATTSIAATWVDATPPGLGVAPMRIGFDPDNPDRVLLGSWGEGLYMSPDGGLTWSQNLDDFFEGEGIASVIVVEAELSGAPASGGVAITASGSYYSTNGGGAWERHPANDAGDSPTIGYMIAPIPDGSGVVASDAYGGIGAGGTFWIYDWMALQWTKGSAALEPAAGASTLGLGFDVSDPPVLYIGNTFRCFWTDDLGATMNNNSAGLTDNFMRAVVGDPEIAGRAIAAVDGGTFLSTTPGGGWVPHGTGLPNPVTALVHRPGAPDVMFAGTNVGVYHSEDRGATWTPMTTEGMVHASLVDIAIHPDRPNILYASANDGTPGGGGFYFMEIGSVVATAEGDAAPGVAPRLVTTPNPFRALTRISYTLDRPGRAHVGIYDLAGRRLAVLMNRDAAAGTRTVVWDGRDDEARELASGIYFARLLLDGRLVEGRRLSLLR